VEWGAYGHDAAGTKHSPATQITRANVKNLVPVWTYRTGDFALGDAMARDETTPLFVDNVLYASTPFGGVRAIDGDTGAELWSFDSELDLSGGYGDFTNRGVSTWVDPSRPARRVTAESSSRRWTPGSSRSIRGPASRAPTLERAARCCSAATSSTHPHTRASMR
jgi:glucose dehydrogenase